MKITYRLTEEDYLEACKLFAKRGKSFRRWARRVMPWEGGLFLVIGIAAFAFTSDRVGPTILCLGGAFLLYCVFAQRRFFRNLYRKNPRSQEEVMADISEDGVHVVSSTADTQLKWAAITRFSESDKIFMFFYTETSFSIVPKRAFEPDEINPFRDLLRRTILISTE